jgi:tetratricopeptide (TPR) repeat protein
LDDQSGTFSDAASQYAEALGETGLAEYHRLAAEAWDNLPSLGRHAHVEHAERYANLLRILDYFAERAGDLEKRIALRAKDLSSTARYLGLAEFCLEQGRREEALRRGEEGLWMFEDDSPDMRLVLFVADLLMRAHRLNEAETCLWQAFQKRPALELYEALRSVSGADARRRAVPFLANRLAENGGPELSELLATMLLRDEMFDEAWAAARTHGASPELLNELARASASSHPREALDFYDSRIKYLAEAGGGQSYREIGSLLKRMAPLQGPTGHTSYVAELKLRYERKRNLIRHLS